MCETCPEHAERTRLWAIKLAFWNAFEDLIKEDVLVFEVDGIRVDSVMHALIHEWHGPKDDGEWPWMQLGG